MQEIKLFGKEIPLSSNEVSGGGRNNAECSDTSSIEIEGKKEEEIKTEELPRAVEAVQQSSGMDTSPDLVTLEAFSVNEDETAKPKSSSANGSREKTLKQPDKILPCPRCNSTETKFCYYNNYNVNQPRHFCKACQRYWTAGGTMRNMPVGAGRRKSKSSSSHYRHITITEALQAAQIDAATNGSRRPSLKNHNGIVLKFGGVDLQVTESRAYPLNGIDKKVLNGAANGFHSSKSNKQVLSNSQGENCDDCSSGSTISATSSNDEGNTNMNFHPRIPCIPGIPWPYPWNYSAVLPPPTLCPPGFGMPFYPAAFLNCSFQNNWIMPSNGVTDQHALGKHPRDGEVLGAEDPTKEEPVKRRNGSVLVPKTLRVDDPNEAAKSTIWSTLGINKESLCKEGFFKGLDSKHEDIVQSGEKIPPALLSNPAALSRSFNFLDCSSA
ncbi:hypothetical protein MLD38_031915 [Melastoma candidum]|uniref:Uncharacterized protein n=1 Tax=Melastoma candidum TaxID=119954 RepID=A0ACB9MQN0_9MYRT|nr:hypothetical protein MLD38_031915 [Melastoma candidum]